ncbi:chemotaxis protein [bacterium]|nr:chemotaxis protein [bacterium]
MITNLIDKENFDRLSSSVTTMYEDRIVASDLLFEMSKILHEQEIAILTSDSATISTEQKGYQEDLAQLAAKYRETKLTEKESLLFQKVQEEFEFLKQNEMQNSAAAKEEALKSINKIDDHLYDLSKIQIQEGRRQVFISDKAKDSIELFTQAEIIFLIIIAILIQVIILYKPKDQRETETLD